MDTEDDPVKLKAENRKLQKEIRTLVVEKNLMEEKLYHAFHKLLQTKKRKVRELEWQIKSLKGDEEDSTLAGTGSNEGNIGAADRSSHCETCRCGDTTSRKKARKVRVEKVNLADSDAEDNGDSDTQDPFAGEYSDETDLDEKPASNSKSSKNTNSPSKAVVVSCHEPSGLSTTSGPSSSTAGSKSAEGTCIAVSKDSTTSDKKKPKEISGNSEKSSSADFDQLVDAFCA